MNDKILTEKIKKVFFIGIGGISMSGLAKHLLTLGLSVSGSDKCKSSQTAELEKIGVLVYYCHDQNNVKGVDLVVYSNAISIDNPELKYSLDNNILTVKRSELLNELLSSYSKSVAISGCHGKTTATAMLWEVLNCANKNPTVFLGGEYGEYGNYKKGVGEYALAEACEYKKSFLDIKPKIAVVLNIDNDHLDSYSDMKDLVGSFRQFVGDRLAVINADEKYIHEISNCTTVTFGIDRVSTYYATDIKTSEGGVSFTAYAYAKSYGKINLSVLGRHNVYNALCVFAIADLLGVPFAFIKKGLENFRGVKRRNELLGKCDGVRYYADYAHHPSEIKATIESLKCSGEDFLTVFQPHTYSRTKILMQDFISAFSGLNNLIIYKSYPAREKYDPKGSSKNLYDKVKEQVPICSYAHTKKELQEQIEKRLGACKRIIFLGAGDIYQIASSILTKKLNLQKKKIKS